MDDQFQPFQKGEGWTEQYNVKETFVCVCVMYT